jgi:hypothetical protein
MREVESMIVSRKYGEDKEGKKKKETGLNKNRKKLKRAEK